jgi:hypothetical protein
VDQPHTNDTGKHARVAKQNYLDFVAGERLEFLQLLCELGQLLLLFLLMIVDVECDLSHQI